MKELRFAHIDGLNKDPCLTDANTKAKGYLQNYTEELTSIKQACHSKRFDNGRIIDVGEAVELMFVKQGDVDEGIKDFETFQVFYGDSKLILKSISDFLRTENIEMPKVEIV